MISASLDQMRREIYPLARRLATRLTQERHARGRGALDFRRTVRASISTGGVPMVTHHKPKRPHRTGVGAAVASYGGVDVLYANAGATSFGPVESITRADWDFNLWHELDVMLWPVTHARPHLRASGHRDELLVAWESAD